VDGLDWRENGGYRFSVEENRLIKGKSRGERTNPELDFSLIAGGNGFCYRFSVSGM
jgi:hypothetical protein